MFIRRFLENSFAKLIVVLGLAIVISCSSSVNSSVNMNRTENLISVELSPTTQKSETKIVQSQELISETSYTGKYTNPTFGYSVIIPSGLKGTTSPPPAPENGFIIKLSEKEDASLSVYGEYNSLFLKSLDEAYEQQINYLSSDSESLKQEEKKSFLLDKHPAIYFTVRYTDKKTGRARITSQVISKRKCLGEEPEIIYTINLDTSESRFAEDKAIMEQIIQSWKMLERCG